MDEAELGELFDEHTRRLQAVMEKQADLVERMLNLINGIDDRLSIVETMMIKLVVEHDPETVQSLLDKSDYPYPGG